VRREIDSLSPARIAKDRSLWDLLLHPVSHEGHYVPENKKNACNLNEPPAPLFGKTVGLQPIDQDAHCYYKDYMGELMNIESLRCRVRLKAPGIVPRKEKTCGT